MTRAPFALVILLLAACNTAPPGWGGAQRAEFDLGGFHFITWHRGDEVQVIRTGWVPRGERAKIPPLMLRAAEQATGCRADPASLTHQRPGDTAVGLVKVAC